MHADCAVDENIRRRLMPYSTLNGDANLLVCPNIESANIAYNLLLAMAASNVAIGPILLGAAKPVNILTPSATVRRIVNMAALTVLEANSLRQPELL
jgi:malate dehydrogenase (oxaloacetate-decarboxylating)(NADP+)